MHVFNRKRSINTPYDLNLSVTTIHLNKLSPAPFGAQNWLSSHFSSATEMLVNATAEMQGKTF